MYFIWENGKKNWTLERFLKIKLKFWFFQGGETTPGLENQQECPEYVEYENIDDNYGDEDDNVDVGITSSIATWLTFIFFKAI